MGVHREVILTTSSKFLYSLPGWDPKEENPKFWSPCFLRWEFIKENKKVRKQENTFTTKKASKKKRKKKENTLSTKKAIKKKKKKIDNGQEKKERKHALDQESGQEKEEKFDNGQEKKKENTL